VCDASFANLAEAVINNLQAVGIRAKLRPLERAAFYKGYSEKRAGPRESDNSLSLARLWERTSTDDEVDTQALQR
jgi:hypothetical protein